MCRFKKNYSYIGKEREIKEREKEIEERLEGIRKAEEMIKSIQGELEKQFAGASEKEAGLQRREEKVNNFASSWKRLNELKLTELSREEIKVMLTNQEGFIKDLLESHLGAEEREELLLGEIDRAMKAIEDVRGD